MSSIEKYEELGFSNNFMFGKIMENENRARRFLEQILGFKIDHVEYIEREKVVDEKFDGRSIRMDIYVDDGQTIYNCEMQTTDGKNLPKRSRYYQSQIDINSLEKGTNFRYLKRSYVIFICTFDPFDHDRYIYTFENICNEDKTIRLLDDTYKVFINAKGVAGEVSEEFKELLSFIDKSEDRDYNNELVRDLLVDLKEARSNEKWRHDYMTWKTFQEDCREEGRAEGREQGREAEKEETIRRMLIKNFPDGDIVELTNCSMETLERIKAELKEK